MILVVDASVALKWFLHIRDNESDSDRALAILAGIDDGRIQLAQPPHFIAEVAAVLAREKAEEAQEDLLDLLNVESQLVHAPAIYATAIRLSIR